MSILRCDRGNAAVELGLILAVLGPIALAGGQKLGPAVLTYATVQYERTVAARDALDQLCIAIADAGGSSTACPEVE